MFRVLRYVRGRIVNINIVLTWSIGLRSVEYKIEIRIIVKIVKNINFILY